MKRYIVRDREAGNEIEHAETLEKAMQIIEKYENEDRQDGNYSENFYEIYDTELEEII